jgi:hypothetical protein
MVESGQCIRLLKEDGAFRPALRGRQARLQNEQAVPGWTRLAFVDADIAGREIMRLCQIVFWVE